MSAGPVRYCRGCNGAATILRTKTLPALKLCVRCDSATNDQGRTDGALAHVRRVPA